MMMNKARMVRNALMTMVITGSLVCGVACAKENVVEYDLGQVVVTATRTRKTVLDTPANTTVITGQQIKEGGFINAFEAVKNSAQANVHTYQEDGDNYGGMISRVRMRGIDNGTLILINGHPSTYMNSANLTNIPTDQIERIEVVKGSGSVLYGPQAMGGVVNIITIKPTKTGKVSGNVFGGFGNLRREAGVNVQTDFINLGFKQNWNKDIYDDVLQGTTGKGTAINLKDKKGQQLYADIALTKDLNFSYGRTDNKVQYEAGSYKNFDAVMNKQTNYDTTYNNYSLYYDNDQNGWKASLGYNTMDIDGKIVWGSGTSSTYNAYNTNFDVQKKFNLKGKNTFVMGANINRESMENTSVNSLGTKYNQNGRNSYSLYQSYDFPTSDKMEFIVGLREYYMASSKFQDGEFQLLPQFQGLYKINDCSNYYFNIGKSFEMPSISSMFYYASNYIINTDLKPQSGWSYELGYKHEKNGRSLAADIFLMKVKDKFFWDKDESGANIMRNRDNWENYGLEINYSQKLSEALTSSIGFTAQNPRAQSNGVWEQDTSKYIINLGANYHMSKLIADVRLFTYLGREQAYYNNEHTSSKIKDHNLKNSVDLTATLSYMPTDKDTVRLIGRNLLNREDAINNYEFRSLPISYMLTYERKF